MFVKIIKGTLIAVVLLGITDAARAQLGKQAVKMGYVTDFPVSDSSRVFINQLTDEIRKTVGASASVQLADQNIVSANWDAGQAQRLYKELSARADLIVVIGSLSLSGILELKPFAVPTIGIGVFDPALQNIPMTTRGTSGVQNFAYALTSVSLQKELSEFKKVVDFKNLALMVEGAAGGAAKNPMLDSLMDSLGTEYEIVPVEDNIDAALNSIPDDADAAFLAMPYGKSSSEIRQLAGGFVKRKLPSYSLLSSHVKLGILSSHSDDGGIEQLMRKIAVLADIGLSGNDLANARVNINYQEKLFLNVNTAEKIDYSPPFEILFTSEIIGRQKADAAHTWTLEEVVSKSLENNLNIRLTEKDVELSENDVKFARSQYLPKLDASATGVQIDQDRAEGSFGGQAERTLSASGTLQQVIYSQQTIANIKIQQYLLEAQEAMLDQQALNILLDTFTAYFNILMAKTNLEIQRENLQSSETNLEFARVRVDIGQSSRSDLFRWESEVANARQSVIQAEISYRQTKLQLSKLLDEELESEFEVEDTSLSDEVFRAYTQSNLGKFISNPDDLRQFNNFLIKEAYNLNPAVDQIDANIGATDRQHLLNRRRFYSPTLSFQGQLDNTLWRGGAGSEQTGGNPQIPLPETDDLTWSLALNLSFPVFNRNQRSIDLQSTAIQQKQLDLQKRNVHQNIELGIRSQMLSLISTSTNVENSRVAAENAEKNFELVQDGYQKGVVPINQLIDAQDAAFSARQRFANSVYDYLLSFLRLENTIGRYTLLSTEQQNQAFIDRYLQFIQENN